MKVTFTTKSQMFPPGTPVGVQPAQFAYGLSGDNGYSSGKIGDINAGDFPDATAPGTYTATVQRLDDNGAALGSSMTGSLVVSAQPEVAADVPDVVTVA